MNNSVGNSSRLNNIMPCPETDDEELSGSYNINEDTANGPDSDCSDSSSKTAISSSSSASSAHSSNPFRLDGPDAEDEDVDDDDDDTDDEDDDDDATTIGQTDELELAQLTNKDTFRLPRGLCENASIFNEFFSLETWQMLPPTMQANLEPLLPDFTSLLPASQVAVELRSTLTQLFNGGVQRFGQSPLAALQRNLEEGNLRPDVLTLRQSIEHSKRRERRFRECERISLLAKELLMSREQMLREAYSMPPDTRPLPAQSRKRKSASLQVHNKFLASRARKRYCLELYDLFKEVNVQPGDISADDEDEDPEAVTVSEWEAISQDWGPTSVDTNATATTAPSTKPAGPTDKKCIYNTFFKRRHGMDDERVIRNMQAAKIPRLNDKNFKKYLRDYKRRKLMEPELPEFDTSDIRLRDVCTRAQFVGNFKPGRKPKAWTARHNEPPALVPISSSKSDVLIPTPTHELLTDEPQQVYGRAAVENDDDDLDMESLTGLDSTSKLLSSIPPSSNLSEKPLPKLEPITIRSTPQTLARSKLCPAPPAKSMGAPISSTSVTLTPTTAHITGSPPPREPQTAAEPHTQPSACYFSLLRDFFVATPNHRMTFTELQSLVVAWRDAHALTASASDWNRSLPDWPLLLQSAINFLAGDYAALPPEYVPYIEHKLQLNIYQWIGAGRDSDARLQSLCNHWLQLRKELREPTPTSNTRLTPIDAQEQPTHQQLQSASITATAATIPTPIDGMIITSPTPAPRCPTNWTVRTATQAEILDFQRQERLRFEQPHRPFTYRMHGYESVVGPVKGIYTQSFSLNKARGHAVMVDERPPYVTILTLVRDATARLPNGEGTRAEISELLKCSQYINQNAAENVLQTIVSGALDRMHGGIDPCVRYDPKRKIWIYLHRNRSEAEFEHLHKHNQTLGKQNKNQKVQMRKSKAKKDDNEMPTTGTELLSEMPALVPAATTTTPVGTLLVKKSQPNVQLPTKCPPVPPLKYNIPSSGLQQHQHHHHQQQQQHQKSLLKTPLQAVQRSGVVTIVDKHVVKTTPPGKQFAQSQPVSPASASTAPTKISPPRNTTPILVSTPSGMQTVHVATHPGSGTPANASGVSVTTAKKVTIKKPIIISNHLGGVQSTAVALKPQQQQQQQQLQQLQNLPKLMQPAQQVGSFILPLEQQHQNKQPKEHMQIQQQQATTKNIIRLVPAGTGTTATTPSAVAGGGGGGVSSSSVALKQVTTAGVQIISPRMLAQTTVRPMAQKIGAVSIISNKSPAATAIPPPTGTIVKMSPQAFATLQQKQLLTKATNSPPGTVQPQQSQPQPQQQHRILVGNTAISSNKNIVFQAVSPVGNQPKIIPQTKILSTTSAKVANLSPQQQRIVLQNFKQPAVQIKTATSAGTKIITSSSAANIMSNSSPTQTLARVIRPGITSSSSSSSPQTGQIITLDGLLQKQTGKVVSTSNIIQLPTSSSNSPTPIATTTTTRNVVSLASIGGQQRLVTTSNVANATTALATATTAAATKLATGRIVSANVVPKIIGKTTVLPGNAKPLVLHAKQLNTSATGGTGLTLKNVVSGAATTTVRSATSGATQLQNIVIGGQAVKIQNAPNITRTAGSAPANSHATSPMQTVIMGHQVLRLQQVSKAATTTTTTTNNSLPTTSSGIASSPKTLVIGSNGQTLRLQSGGVTKNVVLSSGGNRVGNVTTTSSNNLVFAVQGGGGQLFLSPTLQGVNVKPLSNLKVIPMSSNATIGGNSVKIANAVAATATAIDKKILSPVTVLKTSSASSGGDGN